MANEHPRDTAWIYLRGQLKGVQSNGYWKFEVRVKNDSVVLAVPPDQLAVVVPLLNRRVVVYCDFESGMSFQRLTSIKEDR